MMWILLGLLAWIAGSALNVWLAGRARSRATELAVTVIFALTIVLLSMISP